MRIALVVPSIQPSAGGLARNVPRLAVALRDEGVHVDLCSVGRKGNKVHEQPDAFIGAPGWLRPLGSSPEMRRYLLDAPVDLIHANGLWMAPLGYAAAAAGARHLPLVISPRGMLSPWALRRSRLKKLLARWFVHPGAFERAAGWHVTAIAEEDDVRRLGFAQPVCTSPNGVDPPAERAGDIRASYDRVAPQIKGRRVLLFYSRFHSKKGVLELIDTFAGLASRRVAWHLLVVGIPEEYSVEHLRSEAHRRGVGNDVSVLDGRNLPAPYPVAELMVLPSHSENFGQVVAEALANGVPVVTTTGTPWEGLNERGAGACIAGEVVGEALECWMGRSPEELREAGRRGRNWVLAEFSWKASAKRLAAFYAALVEGGSSHAS